MNTVAERPAYRRVALCGAAFALTACAGVTPPDPLDEASPQYEVEYVAITGTRIKDVVEIRRRPSQGALNVTIVTREAIERSGASSVSEAISRGR